MDAKRLRLETIREEGRIMTMDTSGMNEKERLYFENLKDQILARQVGFDQGTCRCLVVTLFW